MLFVTVVVHPDAFVTAYEIVLEPTLFIVTRPVLSTVLIAVLLLLHTPPGVASLNVIVLPTQPPELPLMAATTGDELTVTEKIILASLPPASLTVIE